VFWDADFSGVNFGGFGLNLCPRDMAKLGYLFMNDGVWDGDQIIPTSWVEASTTLNHSTGFNSGYGYQWWLNPEWEAFSARGYLGQRIHVLPNENLVVVFTASRGHVNYDSIIEEYILPAINEFNPILSQPYLIGLAMAVFFGVPITVLCIYFLRRRQMSMTEKS
jgi:CubicO group peptidase (beta-lactamase class C family)